MNKEINLQGREIMSPNLSQHIIAKDAATFMTSERYTLNSLGAVAGWSSSAKMFYNRLDPKAYLESLPYCALTKTARFFDSDNMLRALLDIVLRFKEENIEAFGIGFSTELEGVS